MTAQKYVSRSKTKALCPSFPIAATLPRKPIVPSAFTGSGTKSKTWDRQSWPATWGWRRFFRDRLRFSFWPGRLPELSRNGDRVDPSRFPPQRLVARAMELAVVQAAERNREFVADLAPQGALLGEAQVVRLGGLAPANEAGSGSDVIQMLLVPK